MTRSQILAAAGFPAMIALKHDPEKCEAVFRKIMLKL